ncbi:unnamed protein product [marine sediment metagenome]|uniref:Uncharacterized protein n=1 Tax=marine sediment metagenome TaxID=412755 RepID=X1V610_9ZZZZ
MGKMGLALEGIKIMNMCWTGPGAFCTLVPTLWGVSIRIDSVGSTVLDGRSAPSANRPDFS